MIEMRRAQLTSGDGLIAEEVADLHESWMRHADAVLNDEEVVARSTKPCASDPKSRDRVGGAPAEMVLRLLILKHARNWSYGGLEREVRANLVYRDFTRWRGAGARWPRPGRWDRRGPRCQAAPRKDRGDRRDRGCEGSSDADRHHRGGDQHHYPTIAACWETGCGY